MPFESRYNLKSPGVKRLMREAIELSQPTDQYFACPLEDNLFEWHFTVKGPENTEFEDGYYHGRILLPSQYPMQPPNIILLTPNGRFEINKKICLSISGHHPESWQPSWSIRTALLALIAFMPTPGAGTLGSLNYTKEERQILAKKSLNWQCDICGKISERLLPASHNSSKLSLEESTFVQQINLKAEEETIPQVRLLDNGSLRDTNTSNNLHERIIPNADALDEQNTQQIQIGSYKTDKLWTAAIWILAAAVGLLAIRRLFFM